MPSIGCVDSQGPAAESGLLSLDDSRGRFVVESETEDCRRFEGGGSDSGSGRITTLRSISNPADKRSSGQLT